ncbi:MAG: hypothetical protein JXP34_19460 [Planctomycetes bacterium]|nr:hypothetical protein [Planctomycetota bacterium]
MKRRLGTAALVAAAAALLVAATRVGVHLRGRRGEIQSPGAHAESAATLGIFRGLAIDYLWIRATALQEEGRTFEALQLARWITRLQSRLPEAWVFQAWNLAYNISVTFPPAERWPWVWNGIRLLRDEGLGANPSSLRLHHELAWIFHHKIGGTDDLAHARYKAILATQMDACLAGDGDALPALVAAASAAGETLADPAVESIAARFRAAGLARLRTDWVPSLVEPARYGDAIRELRDELRDDAAYRRLDLALRAGHLADTWGMPPARMEALRGRYGPVDFRSPEAHALYWAAEGIDRAAPSADRGEVVDLLRMLVASMDALFRRGRVILSSLPDAPLIYAPDTRLVGPAHQAYLEAATRAGDWADEFRNGDQRFLEDAAALLLLEGSGEAERWFETLRSLYPHPAYERGIETFVAVRLQEVLDRIGEDPRRAQEVIAAALGNAMRMYAIGEDARGDRFVREARMVWQRYQAREGLPASRRLPPFDASVRGVARAWVERLEAGAATRPLAARIRAKLPPGFLDGVPPGRTP